MINKFYIILFFISGHFHCSAQSYIIVGDTMSNNITYNNIKDTTLQYSSNSIFSYNLDFDHDSITDISFHTIQSDTGIYNIWSLKINSISSIDFILQGSKWNNCFFPNDTFLLDVPKNTLVNNNQNWIKGEILRPLNNTYYYGGIQPHGQYCMHHPFSGTDRYLCFRKTSTIDTIYGWISVNGNSILSYAVNKEFSVGIKERNIAQFVSIYPNPSNSKITIDISNILFTDENKYLIFRNTLGQVILKMPFNPKEKEIDVSALPNGLYFIELNTVNGVLSKKILISK